jgi:acyl carrier protein
MDLRDRLIACFRAVFPDIPESQVCSASHSSVQSWDSIAAVTLANVIEEEFAIQFDFERIEELDSFDRILAYVRSEATLPK